LKRFLAAAFSYFSTGVGGYYTFSGDVNSYSLTILAVGLCGILYDLFHRKVHTE